jgi:hypothetical protein
MAALERLKTALSSASIPSDGVLAELLQQAEELITGYTNRSVMPAELVGLQVVLALQAVNRMGAEGQTERKEGDLSIMFMDIAPSAILQMNRFRIARVPNAYTE